MNRDGKLVIRPDSSPKTPVEIICGDPDASAGSCEAKGLIQCLYEIFGGTVNSKGYIELDPHIGAIYGDSITLAYQQDILNRLMAKGFSASSIVFGVGSFTYQYVTRDTHGIAIKATMKGTGWGNDFKLSPIFKDPKTDRSGKKSAKGHLSVLRDNNSYKLVEYTEAKSRPCGDLLRPILVDGEFTGYQNFDDVRQRAFVHMRDLMEVK